MVYKEFHLPTPVQTACKLVAMLYINAEVTQHQCSHDLAIAAAGISCAAVIVHTAFQKPTRPTAVHASRAICA